MRDSCNTEAVGLVDLVVYGALAVAGAVLGVWLLKTAWLVHGRRKIRLAGPRLLWVRKHRIWREPEQDRPLDLRDGPGGEAGRPAPPFAFVQEHSTGSQPCVSVRDGRGRLWRVKWGHEARPEAFAVRLAWACGYFAEITHFIAAGRIAGADGLARAAGCLDADGGFRDARFELEDPKVRMLFGEHSWSWDDNPFVGTRELSGLKLVVMVLSNWDTKDRRDVSRGSNTAIFEYRDALWGHEARYLITDWGGAMGRWGTTPVSRGRWDVDGFEAQTARFVTDVTDGYVNFAYQGQRTGEITRGITVSHAAWFHRYAGRLTESSLRVGLLTCGATEDEARRFAVAILERIRQIGDAASGELTNRESVVAHLGR
jgi:hypothetical protein